MTTATTEDTEITLGVGKMLGLFFALVLVCAVFFGLGFSLGRNSVRIPVADATAATVVTTGGVRPSAIKPVSSPISAPEVTPDNKPAEANAPASDAAASSDASTGPTSANQGVPPAADPSVALTNGYFVQVAAVSKQEDADALVDALKKKQYPAFTVNNAPDKLFHVQVGPYADIKDAEAMRAKLVSDGYNPILKK